MAEVLMADPGASGSASRPEGWGSVIGPGILRLSGDLGQRGAAPLVSAVAICGQIRSVNAPVGADLRRRNVSPIEQPDQILPRDVQRIGRLLRRQHVVLRQDRDGTTARDDAGRGLQNGKQR